MLLTIILGIIIFYFLLTFFLSRFLVSFMGWSKEPLPKDIPKGLKQKITELQKKCKTKEQFLRKSLDYVSSRCEIGPLKCYTEANKLFWKDVTRIYNEKGYLPCTAQNHLLRVILVHSKRFKESDIKLKVTITDFNVHQYMQVKINDAWIDADPWYYRKYGYNYHGEGFYLFRASNLYSRYYSKRKKSFKGFSKSAKQR